MDASEMSFHFPTQSLSATFTIAKEIEEQQLIPHMAKEGLNYGD